MKKIKAFFAILSLIVFPFVSKAQFGGGVSTGVAVTYSGYTFAAGTLRVSCPEAGSHDFAVGQQYGYAGAFGISGLTLDWSHAYYPGWGTRVVTVSKSTLDAISMGSTIYIPFYTGSLGRYEVTKGYGYSVVGATYNYTLSIKVYEPGG